VRLCDSQTGTELFCFGSYWNRIESAIFSPNGEKVLITSDSKPARLWDCNTGKELCKFQHDTDIRTATFFPDNQMIATGGWDNTLRVWDCQSGKMLYSIPLRYYIMQAKILPNGRSIIINSYQPALQLWELFDETKRFQPTLIWSTSQSLSAQELDISGIKDLSEPNRKLLLQHSTIPS